MADYFICSDKKQNLLDSLKDSQWTNPHKDVDFSIKQIEETCIEQEPESQLINHFDGMSSALKSKRTNIFVNYVHPILYQSIGGKTKFAELMSETYKEVSIKETKVEKILKTNVSGDVVQVLLLQS